MPAGSVTVIVPTRNRLGFVTEAVNSALRQAPHVHRIVVVDDGSDDGTGAWLDGLDEPLVTAVRQPRTGGGAAARNAGFRLCDTPYVMFLDDDDVLRDGALSKLVKALTGQPWAAGAAGAGRRFGVTGPAERIIHPRVPLTRDVWREVLFCWGLYPATLLWRASVVGELGGWSEDLRRFEDRDLVLRAHPRPFALIPDVVADLRVHPGQVTNVAHEELDWSLRQAFVDGLDPDYRASGAAILAAARGFEPALERYRQGDFGPLRRVLGDALSPATALRRSPILAPWLTGLAAKAALFDAAPGMAAATRRVRRLVHQKATR